MSGTLDEALAYAFRQSTNRTQDWTGYCQRFVRSSWQVGALYYSAALAWEKAEFKHTGLAPAGAPIFWTGGSHGFGHVALSAGVVDGIAWCWSTDILRRGWVDKVTVGYIDAVWGAGSSALHRVGWTEDINAVHVLQGLGGEGGGEPIPPPPPPAPPEQPTDEDEPMRYLRIVGEPADANIYGYTDQEWWTATAEEASAAGSVREVNARQRDVIKSRVLSLGRARKPRVVELIKVVGAGGDTGKTFAVRGDGHYWLPNSEELVILGGSLAGPVREQNQRQWDVLRQRLAAL